MTMSGLFRDGNGVVYRHRDGCFDGWLISDSPKSKAGTFRIVTTPEAMTIRQMAQSVTGNPTESIDDLSRAIVAQALDFTPAQFEDQIIVTQKGENILLDNGHANFAFAKTGKILKGKKGDYEEVVMLYADRGDDGQWDAYVDRLDGSDEWRAGDRLLLRNKV